MSICSKCGKKPSCDNVESCTEKKCPFKKVIAAQEKAAERPSKDHLSQVIDGDGNEEY